MIIIIILYSKVGEFCMKVVSKEQRANEDYDLIIQKTNQI